MYKSSSGESPAATPRRLHQCTCVLHDSAFFRFLTQIDAQLAAEARERRCCGCADPCTWRMDDRVRRCA